MPDKLTRSLGSIVDDLWGTPVPRPAAAAAKGDPAPAAPKAFAPRSLGEPLAPYFK